MTRKRPIRAKGRLENRDRTAPQPRPKVVEPSAESPEPAVGMPPRRSLTRLATGVLLTGAAVVYLSLVVVCIWQRWTSEPGTWPTPGEVGLSTAAGMAGTGLLIVTSVLAVLAGRSAGSAASFAARCCLLLALVTGGLFVAWRTYEFRELSADGLWQRGAATSPHDHPDIYYIQAVRLRLQELFQQLEDRRANHPDQFSETQAQRLELVTNLQRNMVAWTEQQVGHWLEDLAQRRGLMKIVAYQIHPLARDKAAVERALQQEASDSARQRQWFAILRDYCEQKSELHRQLGSTTPAEGVEASAAAVSQTVVAARPAKIELRHTSLEAADLALQQKLTSLGLEEWSFARSVIIDTTNVSLTGERLNQIVAQLDAMDSRELFVDELVRGVLERPEAEGLNEKYRWLRLPVYFPHARQWAGCYLALTGFHVVLVACVIVLSFFVLLWPQRDSRVARWRIVQWCWHTSSLIAATLLLLFYIV